MGVWRKSFRLRLGLEVFFYEPKDARTFALC